jgi:hypothetical protein
MYAASSSLVFLRLMAQVGLWIVRVSVRLYPNTVTSEVTRSNQVSEVSSIDTNVDVLDEAERGQEHDEEANADHDGNASKAVLPVVVPPVTTVVAAATVPHGRRRACQCVLVCCGFGFSRGVLDYLQRRDSKLVIHFVVKVFYSIQSKQNTVASNIGLQRAT